ncbi:hypothetical protein ACEWY4_007684 [Coilia grayii]|uniref:DUF4806 domain-containing protein n=1 Tax=Coilia grayii TaxID=363190 RepID=A0ABD1JK79_9TELE
MYSVVIFKETEETEIVPNDWLSLDRTVTFWPPYKGSKCSTAVMKNEDPDEEWKKSSKVAVEDQSLPAIPAFRPPPVLPEMPQYSRMVTREDIAAMLIIATLLPAPNFDLFMNIYYLLVINYIKYHLFEFLVYKLLEEVNGQVRQNTLLLQALHKKQGACELGDVEFDFPLTSFQCVKTIEDRLKNNQEAKRSLTRYLCSLGGATTKDILHRILKHVMCDDLAQKFNWRGRGAKSPFSALSLAKVIIGTVTTIMYFMML